MRVLPKQTLIGLCLFLSGCMTPPGGTPARDSHGLARIEHIVVIYAENRSFDNLYGLFPGANGIANATAATWTQTDRNGAQLAMLPPVWKTAGTPDGGYPAQ